METVLMEDHFYLVEPSVDDFDTQEIVLFDGEFFVRWGDEYCYEQDELVVVREIGWITDGGKIELIKGTNGNEE